MLPHKCNLIILSACNQNINIQLFKQEVQIVYNSHFYIFATDKPNVITFKNMNQYYVYFLIDPRDNQVFYIGKGTGDRINEHFSEIEKYMDYRENREKYGKVRFSNTKKLARMMQIRKEGLETIRKKVKENLSQETAYVLEEILIERFGREVIKTGKLTNLEPGGNWSYPKVILKESKKTTIEEVKAKYPELLDVLEKYPNIATDSPMLKKFENLDLEKIFKKNNIAK